MSHTTHEGKYQARLLARTLNGESRPNCQAAPPQVVFTDPQVGAVGITEQQACDAGHAVRVVHRQLSDVAASAVFGETKGAATLVIDHEREVVLGTTIVGPLAGEMLHAATIAIVGEVPLDVLRSAIPAFPTMSEIWLELLEGDRKR
jgi:dihydrolipoamide dehydrogenase